MASILSRFVLVACVLGLTASRAQAQDHLTRPTITFAAAATADWITTYRFLSSPYGIPEANPMLAFTHARPVPTVLAGTAMDVAGVYAWRRFVGPRHQRIARVGLYAAAGFRVWLAARNVRHYGAWRDYRATHGY